MLYQPIRGPFVQLYDQERDPEETTNLAHRNERAGLIRQLLEELANHLVRTAREPEGIPRSRDVNVILMRCLAPRDVDKFTYLRNWMQRSRP